MDVAQVPMQYSYSERAFLVDMFSSSGEVQSERRANARGYYQSTQKLLNLPTWSSGQAGRQAGR